MATIHKRGNKWRAQVYDNGGRRSKSFNTKGEATQWALEEERKLDLQKKGLQPETLLSDVVERYLKEITPTKRGVRHETLRLNRFMQHPICSKYIGDVTRKDFELWIAEREKSVSGESIRRELSTIKHIFTVAVERWDYIERNPTSGLVLPKGSPPRTQRYSDEEIERLLYVSGYHDTLKTVRARTGAAMLFAIETAMRAGEICGLTWDNVDFEDRTAYLPITKNGSSRRVPLSKKAIAILERLKEEVGNTGTCFQIESKSLDATFRKLKKMAMCEHLHFHDTRREALTRLAKKVDVMTLAKISGHKDIRILQNVYYAPNMADIAGLLD